MPALPGLSIDAKLKAELTGLLTEELALCEDLLGSIRREQDCLQHYDHAGFASNAEHRNALINSLRQLDNRRTTLFRQLQGADLSTGNLTFQHWQERMLGDPGLSGIVQQLRQVAAACAAENQALGRLISLQTRFFDFLLKQLMPERNLGLTYAQTGETRPGAPLRKLASA
ncbi:MAG TPA: flagellar protein FlgN [Candidatus Acidoferrum sp.]|nr:flagellar protein FlgN [Candidatus Acidoferrum sp.]